jgi:hypothetical protein
MSHRLTSIENYTPKTGMDGHERKAAYNQNKDNENNNFPHGKNAKKDFHESRNTYTHIKAKWKGRGDNHIVLLNQSIPAITCPGDKGSQKHLRKS